MNQIVIINMPFRQRHIFFVPTLDLTKYAKLIFYTVQTNALCRQNAGFASMNFKIKNIYVRLTEGEVTMKQIQKRMLLQIILGFFLGRVSIFGLNPFGIAYFAAGFTEGGAVFPVALAVFIGMIGSSTSMETAICGGMVMVSLILAADILDKREIHIKMGHAALISAAVSASLWVLQLWIMPYNSYKLWIAVLSSILLVACTRVFYDGIHFILYSKKYQNLDNEEMISIIIIAALSVLGFPKVFVADVSITGIIVYVMLLMAGYCYGTGTGAVAGAAAGIVFTIFGGQAEMVGIMALLGICAGILRSQGKLWMVSVFFITAMALNYVLDGNIMEAGTIKAVAAAGVIFLCIPSFYLRKFGHYGGSASNDKKGVQDMMRHRLEEFSDAFHKLSGALMKQTEDKYEMNNHDMREMMKEMSTRVCGNCENSTRCMGPDVLCKPEIFGTLAVAQEQGCIVPDQMPAEFLSECIYPDRFLTEANQNLYITRTLMGFRNRMAESRRVVAGQMKEVGDMVQRLADNMPHIKDFSIDIEEKIVTELERRRVIADDIFAYEKQDGRLEISMQARTSRGRLVTSAEVARILSQVLGKTICPSDESRKVLVNEMMHFVFVEDTPLYSITGVARRPKDGGEVSGDAFSCISLPGGEMLLALSDGMGSGDEAMEESKTVIELLEQMTEAGFSHNSAIRLINSLYMSKDEEDGYATADIVILNLFKGDCCFLKNGASATYLRHNRRVMMIEGQTLPVGVVHEIESYVGKVGISNGDYVIMMTDGVSDCFMNSEDDLSEYLKRCEIINPHEIAKHILDEAVRRSGGKAADDMTVIVAGIWERGMK